MTCMICECESDDGIKILTQFLCRDCEQDLIHTTAEDDLYAYFVMRLRAVWRDLIYFDADSRPTGY